MRALVTLAAAGLLYAADASLYVFDNGVGAGALSVEEQVQLTKRTGYAGVFYAGTKDIPQLLSAHQARGLKVLGIYTGMDLAAVRPGYEPGLPEAIRQLKGSGALITFTVKGKAVNGDDIAVPVIREVCDLAAQAGLKVALYPHYGFHVARVEDALRVREKAGRSNLGVVFNLCHWLRSGDAANLEMRVQQALPYILMVSINGADPVGGWDRLIQTLDRGSYDVRGFLQTLAQAGYKGPVGLQCYNVQGDREENLMRSMRAWRGL